jgi:hypothetical protein
MTGIVFFAAATEEAYADCEHTFRDGYPLEEVDEK